MEVALRNPKIFSRISLILFSATRSSLWLLCADIYPAIVAACIPWSTTAVAVFVAIWLMVLAPTINPSAFKRGPSAWREPNRCRPPPATACIPTSSRPRLRSMTSSPRRGARPGSSRRQNFSILFSGASSTRRRISVRCCSPSFADISSCPIRPLSKAGSRPDERKRGRADGQSRPRRRRDQEQMQVICPTCQFFSVPSKPPMTWRAGRSDENRFRQARRHIPHRSASAAP
jgi:hypothetical protein